MIFQHFCSLIVDHWWLPFAYYTLSGREVVVMLFGIYWKVYLAYWVFWWCNGDCFGLLWAELFGVMLLIRLLKPCYMYYRMLKILSQPVLFWNNNMVACYVQFLLALVGFFAGCLWFIASCYLVLHRYRSLWSLPLLMIGIWWDLWYKSVWCFQLMWSIWLWLFTIPNSELPDCAIIVFGLWWYEASKEFWAAILIQVLVFPHVGFFVEF